MDKDDAYSKLLDRAFSMLPALSVEKIDFKVPEVDAIVQGNKTIIRNFYQIADAARRNKEEIAKYITKEIAAPVSIDDQKLVIGARIQSSVLNEKTRKYFDTYVICKECHKPDTRMESAEHGYELLVCEACGARYTIKRS